MTAYLVRARLAGRRRARGRRADRDSTASGSRRSRPASPRTDGARRARGPDAPGSRQRALAQLPAGAARPHAARRGRIVLDLARADVRAGAGLDPDSFRALARATFAEMALAGITLVGEFHYVHHDRDGTPYDEPNTMGAAIIAAAADAGIRADADRRLLSQRRPAPVPRCRRRSVGAARLAARDGHRARHRRGDSQRPRGRPGERRVVAELAARARLAAARPRLRAAGRERDDAARRMASHRPRCSTASAPSSERFTAIHTTHMTARRHPPPRRGARVQLLVPDDRARPRRRHRSGTRARRRPARGSRSAATPTPSSTCSRRRARSSSTSGSATLVRGRHTPARARPRDDLRRLREPRLA